MGNRLHKINHRRGGTECRGGGENAREERHSRRSSNNNQRQHRDKIVSCPDLVRSDTNTRFTNNKREEDERKFEFKIYRSYSELPDSKRSSFAELPPIEVKVYRRSTEGLAGGYGGRAVSLPRGMERMTSRGGTSSIAASQDLSASVSGFYPSHPPSTCSGGGGGGHEVVASSRSSRRTSARSSMASLPCRITPEEFPDVPTIKRKLADFSTHFSHSLVETFLCLPPLNQLSSLAVATRPDRANQSVSLLQYLESDSIPADLLGAREDGVRREYFLTVSPAIYGLVRRVKSEALVDQRLTVAKEIVVALAQESAVELCRMFEYQLSLINEPIAVRMLAKYAVDCVYDVMKRRQRLLDRNTVVQGAVKGRPRDSKLTGRQLISVIIGSKELKWNLFDIFKKPGLRKDMFTTQAASERRPATGGSTDIDSVPLRSVSRNGVCPGSSREDFAQSASRGGSGFGSREELRPAPWRYFTSAQSEPMLYGYRGQMVEWDFVNCHYKLNTDDEMCFAEEVCLRYDDFHRLYCPYMWLIGLDILQEYRATVAAATLTAAAASYSSSSGSSCSNTIVEAVTTPAAYPPSPPTLVQFVKQSRSGVYYVRDEIKLVFKPLGVLNKSDASIAGVNNNSDEMALVSDAAMEIASACDALRCKLEDIDEARSDPYPCAPADVTSRGTNGGSVLIHVTCPDGYSKPPGEY